MRNNTEEKSLIKRNMFYNMINFIRYLFKRHHATDSPQIENLADCTIKPNINHKSDFMEAIKNIENEETRLLKLQKQYDNGEIGETELSDGQVTSLCNLYDKQINELKKINKIKKQRILQCKNNS